MPYNPLSFFILFYTRKIEKTIEDFPKLQFLEKAQ
jgi:hypothetical protein